MAILEIEGRTFSEVVTPPGDKPQPLPEKPTGWEPGVNDWPFRVRPWAEYIDRPLLAKQPVTLWEKITEFIRSFFARPSAIPKLSNYYFTNEMEPPCIIDADGVHPNWTKPVLRWDRRPEWQHRFEALNSYAILDVFVNGGYGWCDLNPNPTTPYEGECKYNVIDCSLNLRNAIRIHLHNGNRYVEYQVQDFNAGPGSKTWENDPQLMIKQVQAVRELDNHRTSYQGDIIWDWQADTRICLHLSKCWIYPGYSWDAPGFTPFDCLYDGYAVTVGGYIFSGSETYILVTGGELASGWYLAQWQDSQGDEIAKTIEDYRCLISGVSIPEPTPPVAEWRVE